MVQRRGTSAVTHDAKLLKEKLKITGYKELQEIKNRFDFEMQALLRLKMRTFISIFMQDIVKEVEPNFERNHQNLVDEVEKGQGVNESKGDEGGCVIC